ILAFILLVAIALPWYLAIHYQTAGVWTRGFLFEHNFQRFSQAQEGHGGLFVLTVVFAVLGLLPFSAYIGEIFKQRRQLFASPVLVFSGVVVAVFIIFFSISSTKLPNYPLPCFPFAALILGRARTHL